MMYTSKWTDDKHFRCKLDKNMQYINMFMCFCKVYKGPLFMPLMSTLLDQIPSWFKWPDKFL